MSKFPEETQFRVSSDFANRLKEIMDDSEYPTNKQFAELVGVSVPVISKAVNFGIIPSTRSLVKIADCLEISLKYLLGIDDTNEFIPAVSKASFYIRLSELTYEKKLNYGRLASKMDFPRTYIYEWLKNGELPTIGYVLELAEFFKVSPDYLMGRSDFRI